MTGSDTNPLPDDDDVVWPQHDPEKADELDRDPAVEDLGSKPLEPKSG